MVLNEYGRYVVLGQTEISRKVLVTSLATSSVFNDGYFRGYRDSTPLPFNSIRFRGLDSRFGDIILISS